MLSLHHTVAMRCLAAVLLLVAALLHCPQCAAVGDAAALDEGTIMCRLRQRANEAGKAAAGWCRLIAVCMLCIAQLEWELEQLCAWAP